jgi:hypothetical protein
MSINISIPVPYAVPYAYEALSNEKLPYHGS